MRLRGGTQRRPRWVLPQPIGAVCVHSVHHRCPPVRCFSRVDKMVVGQQRDDSDDSNDDDNAGEMIVDEEVRGEAVAMDLEEGEFSFMNFMRWTAMTTMGGGRWPGDGHGGGGAAGGGRNGP